MERTRLAHERTLMAWIRTSISLISFGFTIYKFFDLQNAGTAPTHRLISPRGYALMMIVIGMAALILASIQHRRYFAGLRETTSPGTYSIVNVVALLVAFMGVATFATVLLHG